MSGICEKYLRLFLLVYVLSPGIPIVIIIPLISESPKEERFGLMSQIRAVSGTRHWKSMISIKGNQHLIALALCIALLCVIPSFLQAESALSYSVKFRGIEGNDLKKLLSSVSDTVSLRQRPPISVRLLEKRVERDIPVFERALRSQGFYASSVNFGIDESKKPIEVIFDITLGPLYRVQDVDIVLPEEKATEIRKPSPEQLGFEVGRPTMGKDIRNGGKILVRWYKVRGYPFSRIAKEQVALDHEKRMTTVILTLDPGQKAFFGETVITGLARVKEAFIRKMIAWNEGDLYDGGLVEKTEEDLRKLGLFASVRINPGEGVDEQARIPMKITVTEKKPRSAGAGVSYRTDEGPGANVSWEHRNVFKRGENIKISTSISDFELALDSTFEKPAFLRKDQTLTFSLRLAEDSPDAYVSRNITTSALLDRKIKEGLTLGGGLGFKTSRVDQIDKKESYDLVVFPFYAKWDGSDDLLNPKEGGRLGMLLRPFWSISADGDSFVKVGADYTHYFPLSKTPSVTLAGRIALGTISGAEKDQIPADERFYSGGGGSIRGYAYQTVGPLQDGRPTGGRSLLELSLEARVGLTENIGAVAFLDGGTAFEGKTFDSGENLLWGAGLGLRYHTPVGPLRIDVGFPLDRREIDGSFQLYLSLGQAF
jgi:translocation and assembly module TamA